MKKLLAIFALSIVLIGVVAPAIKVEAVKQKIPYIVVTLDSVYTLKDAEEGEISPAPGEIETLSIVFTGKGEPQIMAWPIQHEGSSWHDGGVNTMVSIHAPIFSLREDEMQDGLAIFVQVVDNDEAPGWVNSLTSGILTVLEKGAGAIGGFWGYAAQGAVAVAKALKDPIMNALTDNTDMGTLAKVLIPADWNSGNLQIIETVGDGASIVTVSVRRVMVPAHTPPLEVRLISVQGVPDERVGDDDWGDNEDGNPFIHTRVFDDLTIPADQIQTHDLLHESNDWVILSGQTIYFPYPPGDPSEGETIFRTGSVGPFLFVEIDVWDYDMASPNDELGIYSWTFFPDQDWGVGRQSEIRWGLDEGNVRITFEIVELPWSDPEIIVEPDYLAVKPGDFVIYKVTVKNDGNALGTFVLSIEGLDPNWYWFELSEFPPQVTLLGGESQGIRLYVFPTKDWSTKPGPYDFNVTATSRDDPEISDSDSATVNVLPFHDLWVGVAPALPDVFTAEPSDSVLYTFGVRNLGNVNDNFTATLGDLEYIKESWTDIWPRVFWNLAPGQTQTGWVEIEVPKDWGRLGLETATDHFLVIAASQAEPEVQKSAWAGLTINIGERELSLDLSGQADYLWMEQVKIKIGALVKDINADLPLSGATVNLKIYRPPDGQLWTDTAMIESAPGLYVWQSEKTIQEYIRSNNWPLVKGTFIAYVEAQYEDGPKTTKTISFHLDPPAEAELPSIAYYLTTIIISIVATLALSKLLYNRRFRKPEQH